MVFINCTSKVLCHLSAESCPSRKLLPMRCGSEPIICYFFCPLSRIWQLFTWQKECYCTQTVWHLTWFIPDFHLACFYLPSTHPLLACFWNTKQFRPYNARSQNQTLINNISYYIIQSSCFNLKTIIAVRLVTFNLPSK